MLISSQRWLDDDTVQAKRVWKDYVVTVSPEFEIDGIVMQAIIDGHHALAAAKADGVVPEIIVATKRDDDRVALIEKSIDDFLIMWYLDSDWYDVETGIPIF